MFFIQSIAYFFLLMTLYQYTNIFGVQLEETKEKNIFKILKSVDIHSDAKIKCL